MKKKTRNSKCSRKTILSGLLVLVMVVVPIFGLTAYGENTGSGGESKGADSAQTVSGNAFDAESSIGEVSGIKVELNDVLTEETVNFKGGTISENVENYNGATFAKAYILLNGDASRRYPLAKLGTINGKVCYQVDEEEKLTGGAKLKPAATRRSAKPQPAMCSSFPIPAIPVRDMTLPIMLPM